MHRNALKKRLAVAVALLALAVLCADAARAEEVILHNGKVRRGKVVGKDTEFLLVETPIGRIRIPLADVAEIRGDGETSKPAPVDDTPLPPVVTEPVKADTGTGTDAGQAVAADGETDDSPTGAAERLRRLERSRVVRRLLAGAAPEAADTGAAAATVGGLLLKQVPKGTPIIVFHPPRPFAAAPGAIEIGRRLFARMGLAGEASVFVARPTQSGEEQVALRLANVTRHVEVLGPGTRMRLFEGINGGDWVRVRQVNGETLHGRLAGVMSDDVRLVSEDENGDEVTHTIALRDVVEVDGLIRDSAAQMALIDIEPGEPLAITFWPDGEELLGRFVDSPASIICLDLDGDGVVDRNVRRGGPLAQVRRLPPQHREMASKLTLGTVVRVSYREEFPNTTVRRTRVGPVASLTAFALGVTTRDGAVIAPFDEIAELVIIEDEPDEEVARWRSRIDRDASDHSLPILPGRPIEEAAGEADGSAGISTINDGRLVTHVFVSAPYAGEAFGVRIGEPITQALRRSPLRFDTVIQPRPTREDPRPNREYISDTIRALRVVLLVDATGSVAALEVGLNAE